MTKVRVSVAEWHPVFYITDEDEYTGLVDPIIDMSDEKIKEIVEVFKKFDEIQDYLCELTPDD